jgi:hypothetical protein
MELRNYLFIIGISNCYVVTQACVDLISNCEQQVSIDPNYCITQPLIRDNCPKSCGLCGCKDSFDNCYEQITINPNYCITNNLIKKICRKTCGLCTSSQPPSAITKIVQELRTLLAIDVSPKGDIFPEVTGPNPQDHVCIVGAGPAGIHMALSLKDKGFKDVTIFEKTGRVGGKIEDVQFDGYYQWLGAVFLTADYFDNVVELAKRYNVGELHPIHTSGIWDKNDGFEPKNKLTYNQFLLRSLMRITNNASPTYNLSLFLKAVIKYVKLHHSMFGKYQGELMQKPTAFVLTKTAGSIKDFLEREMLQPLIPYLEISNAAQGFGYLDEIAALYGLFWITPNLIITAAFRALKIEKDPYQFYIFKNGFEKLLNTIVKEEKFDIRFNTAIQNIIRTDLDISILYKNATSDLLTETCGFLIWSPPMPELVKYLSSPTKGEYDLFAPLSSHGVVSSVMRANGTIRNRPIVYYRESLQNKIDGGVVMDMDVKGALNYCDTSCDKNLENYDLMSSSRVISVLQLLRNATNSLYANDKDRVHNNIQKLKHNYENKFNSSNIEILSSISQDYFYKWNPHEIEKGNHWKVFEMQGKYRTWYIGASVSSESVKSVMEYNKLRLRQFRPDHASHTSNPAKFPRDD